MDKVLSLVEMVDELHSDAAGLSTDISNLQNEIVEKIRELTEIQQQAEDTLGELADILEEAHENDEDEFFIEDEGNYSYAAKLLDEIETWLDEATDD